MAWIRMIPEDEAEGDVARAYARAVGPAGGPVDNILKIHSIAPKALADHLALYRNLMFGESPLSRTEREAIAVVVSVMNKCRY